jgi:intermembrane space import and assembly protein 40
MSFEAVDPITGKIDFSCPCMGNKPKGPCGEIFKKAFTCFVKNYDTTTGKIRTELVDCTKLIDSMNTCFRKYPNIYN